MTKLTQRGAGNHRIRMTLVLVALLVVVLPDRSAKAENDPVAIKTFVTQLHFEGVPYEEARALGAEAIPELLGLLKDTSLEQHWATIIFTLGAIGDPSAREPLVAFLTGLSDEVSVHSFRAALAVPPALGQLAHAGDDESLKMLVAYTHPEDWRQNNLKFSYQRYKEEALGEVMGRMALQGLGLSGRDAASSMLHSMSNDQTLPDDWRDNVEEAMSLCDRVSQDGLAPVFEQVAP